MSAVVTDDIERASVFVHEWRSLDPDVGRGWPSDATPTSARFRAVIADGVETGAFEAVDPTRRPPPSS